GAAGNPSAGAPGPAGPIGPMGYGPGVIPVMGYNRSMTPVVFPSGTPGSWVTLNTIHNLLVSTDQLVVKLDAAFQLAFSSPPGLPRVLNITYQILRNGDPVYSNAVIYDQTRTGSSINFKGPVSLTFVDEPSAGSYTYTLRARVESQIGGYNPTVSERDFNASVFQKSTSPNYVYVAHLSPDESTALISYVDPVTNTITGASVPVGVATGGVPANLLNLAISPDETQLYVANLVDSSLYAVHLLTREAVKIYSFEQSWYTNAMLVTPDNNYLYAADLHSGIVKVFDAANKQFLYDLHTSSGENVSLTVSPDSSTVFVAINNMAGTPSARGIVDAIPVGTQSVTHDIFASLASQYGSPAYMEQVIPFAVVGYQGAYQIQALNVQTQDHSPGDIFSAPVNDLFNNQRITHPLLQSPLSMTGLPNNSRYIIQSDVDKIIRMNGNTVIESIDSYTDQREIAVTPDRKRICVLIRSSINQQQSGLQVISVIPAGISTPPSAFIPLASSGGMTITADSKYAYSLTFYPNPSFVNVYSANLISKTAREPLAMPGQVHAVVASYTRHSVISVSSMGG
ncbi:hypothetical protein K0U00_09470, partial [Paenibacillus sepulcri]|nr:hypothetical protein [Paenibacillus sepulcri]